MNRISMKAYAKINITLDVMGKNEDEDMHLLDSLMQTIDLHDTLSMKKRRDNLVTCVTTVGKEIKDSNAEKAAKLFMERFGTSGVDIEIVRRIPIGGGLGGSSADAVAVLKMMALLFNVNFGELEPLARELGSDTLFLLQGGLARCTGYGDVIEKLPPLPPMYVLLATPPEGSSTSYVFSAFDNLKKRPPNVKTEEILAGISEYKDVKIYVSNVLTGCAEALNNGIGEVMKAMQDKKSLMLSMTGSGSSVFALYRDLDDALDKMYEMAIPADVYRLIS